MSAFNARTYNYLPYDGPGLAYEPPDSLRSDVRSFDPKIQDGRSLIAPRYGVVLSNYTVGDWWVIQRTFAVNSSKILLTKVYWTVYHGISSWVVGTVADQNSVGTSAELILQAIIRPSPFGTPVSGNITDSNPTDGTISFYGVLRHVYIVSGFPSNLTSRGTGDLIAGVEYPYDLQAVDANGSVYTLETGTIIPGEPCTRVTTTPPPI